MKIISPIQLAGEFIWKLPLAASTKVAAECLPYLSANETASSVLINRLCVCVRVCPFITRRSEHCERFSGIGFHGVVIIK